MEANIWPGRKVSLGAELLWMVDGAIEPSGDDTVEFPMKAPMSVSNRQISGRGSRTVLLRLMVTGGGGHNVYPGLGPLDGGNTLLPACLILII